MIVFVNIQVKSIKVDHPADAHGFLVSNKLHSVVYSGDTKPCQALIREGKYMTVYSGFQRFMKLKLSCVQYRTHMLSL